MKCFLQILLFWMTPSIAQGFVLIPSTQAVRSWQTARFAAGVDLETLSDIGYFVSVKKPLGVVFGENRAPFYGLVVDAVDADAPGAAAGLRVGDQLMAVAGQSVLGQDFEAALGRLQQAASPVELQLYRGTATSLYTIVVNRRGEDFVEEEEDDEVAIVFDESYESPVIMTAEELGDDTISVSQVAKETAATIGTMLSPKSIGGFFGQMFSQETIQLEDKDGK